MARALPTWEELRGKAAAVGDVKLLAAHVPGADADALRRFGDAVQAQKEPWVGVFVAEDDKGKVPVVVALSAPLVQRGWHSRDLVRAVAGVLGGGGGGNKAELCTGSGKDADKIPQALAEAERAVRARTS
jgi:alanyl-tRNA synthetase